MDNLCIWLSWAELSWAGLAGLAGLGWGVGEEMESKFTKIAPRVNVKLISHLSVTDRCEIQLYICPLAVQRKLRVEKACEGSQGRGGMQRKEGERERGKQGL